jgi:hypothetical protein
LSDYQKGIKNMKNLAISTLAIGIAISNSLSVSAATIKLYEPGVGLIPNTSTADGGPWLTQGGLLGGGTETSLGTSGTNLNTTLGNGILAGYGNRVANLTTNPATPGDFVNSAFPSLDRTTGYTLSFNVAIKSESRTNNDRAGFSVIALSSDTKGIEIGFQDNIEVGTIFAQDPEFTQGEFTNVSLFEILRASTDYELTILGDTYTLSANNTQILTGGLRTYNPTVPINPYETPDFIFLGDDSTSAQASVNLGAVSLTTTPVPFEFSPALGLVAIGAWAIAKKIKK